MLRRYWPLAAFIVLLLMLAAGLRLNPRELPSALIDKPAPDFRLTLLDAPDRAMSRDDMAGQVWVLNVWASWCVACRQEHPVLLDLARSGEVNLYGLNYKDERPTAQGWLERHGNPYRASLFDGDGRLGIDLGVYGVPETFVIDRQGRIRYKHVGPLTPEIVRERLLPAVRAL
ncbi:MAG: DsbE family thiol:disulfide interchange protein [Betaproteobacteria bacterium]|nr:DsbE family thiol:disulfide interchange protein [Betaproteobacteria bacterium]